MKSHFHLQFRFPRDTVIKHIKNTIPKHVYNKVTNFSDCSSLDLDDKDVFSALLSLNAVIAGKGLVRLAKEEHFEDCSSVLSSNYYEIELITSPEPKLLRAPKKYYSIEIDCPRCGRLRWNQTSDIELTKRYKSPIQQTANGEILITKDLYNQLKTHGVGTISKRPTNFPEIFQLIIEDTVSVCKTQHLIEKAPCSKCGKPRTIFTEDSNGVSFLSEDETTTRIERRPEVRVSGKITGISKSDLEFGTIGRIPENALHTNPLDVGYKTSWPKIFTTGDVARIFLNQCKEQIAVYAVCREGS